MGSPPPPPGEVFAPQESCHGVLSGIFFMTSSMEIPPGVGGGGAGSSFPPVEGSTVILEDLCNSDGNPTWWLSQRGVADSYWHLFLVKGPMVLRPHRPLQQ